VRDRGAVSSLIQHLSPELRYSALEVALKMDRLPMVEMMLAEEKPENEWRAQRNEEQIEKFNTGEIGQMAFGVKVRKVNMMRGNRQGNNAFIEDSKHEHLTPVDYLINNVYCHERIFRRGNLTKKML